MADPFWTLLGHTGSIRRIVDCSPLSRGLCLDMVGDLIGPNPTL